MTNLNEHIEKIVENIVAEINASVMTRVDGIISNAITNRLANYDFSESIREAAGAAIEKKVSEYAINPKKLESKIVEKINQTITEVESQTSTLINEEIQKHVAATNFQQSLTNALETVVARKINDFDFPEKSISAGALNFDGYTLSGDQIDGGLIKNFSSTGIDDRATQVALTILDDATVVENNLLTKDLTIHGSAIINGNLVINGTVPKDSNFFQGLVTDVSTNTLEKINTNLFSNFSDVVFNKIKQDGIDLLKVTFNGDPVFNDNAIGARFTESNLQKLGTLRELQVSGESLLSETFYTTKNRVGINTIEPSAALSVWDNEIEITVSKRQKDVGSIGTPRNQKLVLFANGKENVVLEPDGSTTINELRIGEIKITSANKPPNYESDRNHIVWNTNPAAGGPIGWVCLGGANWANFGIID